MKEQPTSETLNTGVDEVRRTLTQFDAFRDGTHVVVPFGEGGDNTTYLVDDTWVFRFAKHQDASEKEESEIRLLPHLQKVMPVTIPEVSYAGLQENGNYFFGYKVIAGEPLTRSRFESLSSEIKERVTQQIVATLRTLIGLPLEVAREAKVREMNMRVRHKKILQEWRESSVYASCPDSHKGTIEAAFERYLSDEHNFAFTPALINTDFSCNHILVNSEGTDIAGIIDWSDMTIGDPNYLFPRLWIDLGEETAIDIIRRSLPDADIKRIRFFVMARSLRSAVRDGKKGKAEAARVHLERATNLARELVE